MWSRHSVGLCFPGMHRTLGCHWDPPLHWLTVENGDQSDWHHQESHQQISYSQRHQKVVGGILQLFLQWHCKDNKDVATDGGDDDHEDKERSPLEPKRRPLVWLRGVGLQCSHHWLGHGAATERVTGLGTGRGSALAGPGDSVSMVLWAPRAESCGRGGTVHCQGLEEKPSLSAQCWNQCGLAMTLRSKCSERANPSINDRITDSTSKTLLVPGRSVLIIPRFVFYKLCWRHNNGSVILFLLFVWVLP